MMATVREWLRQIWIPTSSTKLAEAEQRVLSVVRFPFEQNQISIGDGLTINTLHTYNPKARQSNKRSPLVLLHGFGAGIGFWLLNIDALAEQHEHVYAIDLLGCGRSSRPHFRAKTSEEAERFFVDALERWRIQLKLDKMILLGKYIYHLKNILNFIFYGFIIGHSLGAYISASYAMSFPSRVSHLILASPVGVPKEPQTPEPPNRRISFGWRFIRSFFAFLWNRGYTPLSIVRLIGPMGPRPVTGYVTRRFVTGPAIEDEPSVTSESGLETSAALADQIDKGKLKLPKQDVAQYLVCYFFILSSTYKHFIYFF
jgi:pimeloyl-ACP methyl ester carboxylesterase